MFDFTTSLIQVGLDVHKDSIAVCVLRPGSDRPETCVIPHTAEAVRRLVGSWARPELIRACYEAGPTGYELHRLLTLLGISCQVIAPALVPRRPGVRVKTDRRDAESLARFLRAGELTPIRVPSVEEEAVRDLVRLREDLKADVLRAKHRLSKFLLRQGRTWSGKNWTKGHLVWLRKQTFAHEALEQTFRHYLTTLELRLAQLAGLDRELEVWATRPPFAASVARLSCLRGIAGLSALTIAAEVVDFTRFGSAQEFASFVGLVPSEYSSGQKEQRGHITKTGNAHVRRVLVEAAWHYRHRPVVGENLKKRSQGQPPEVLVSAWQTQMRLFARYRRLVGRDKRPTVAIVAVARELAQAVWALMCLEGGAECAAEA